MSVFRSTNPFLTEQAFAGDGRGQFGNFAMREARPTTMTLQGTVNATFILLGITLATAIFCWSFLQTKPSLLFGAALVGSLVTLVGCVVTWFKRGASPYVAPFIAVAQGCTAGALSVLWTQYAAGPNAPQFAGSLGTGLVLQAALLTIGIAGGLLVAYKSRLIKATENFKLGVVAATGGLFFVCIASMVLSMFGLKVPYIWENGPIGIAFAGVIVVIAALNLVLDFDFIEQGSEAGLPKHMEWYAAIGLLITLVWLYVSILRMLAMLQRRD
jgi:uncharacterized YccA/Bax inhibitor family protein